MNTQNLNHGLVSIVFWDMISNTKGIDVGTLSLNVSVSHVMSSFGSIKCFILYPNSTSLKILLFLFLPAPPLIYRHLLRSHHQMNQTLQILINLILPLLILLHQLNHYCHLNHCHQMFHLQTNFQQWSIPLKMPRLLILSVNQLFHLLYGNPLG